MTRIIAVDRGSKRIGLAWMDTENNLPLPLGYLFNNSVVYSQMASLIMQYNIDMVLYGFPHGNHHGVHRIQKFIKNMKYCVSEDVKFLDIDEHYSSTQAGDRTGDRDHKHISQDTVSAMILLERRQDKK